MCTIANFHARFVFCLHGKDFFSADFFSVEDVTKEVDNELDQTSPKLGLFWDITNQTTVRAAAYRVLKRTASSNQTIERTNM